jgi:plasmid stabilization system protein ParE
VKVLWTESALAQLQAVHDYLAQTSPEYALRIIDRLTKRSIQIARFPFSGRMVPEYELNEVREVIEGPYRIIYLIGPEQQKVEVLAVIHSLREPQQPLK